MSFPPENHPSYTKMILNSHSLFKGLTKLTKKVCEESDYLNDEDKGDLFIRVKLDGRHLFIHEVNCGVIENGDDYGFEGWAVDIGFNHILNLYNVVKAIEEQPVSMCISPYKEFIITVSI